MAEEQPLLSISSEPPAIPQPRVVVEQRNLTLDAFRALADPIRLELLALIAARGPVCVCHLQEQLPYTQPRISKHLAVLRRAGLVSVERRGSWAYYSPNLEMIDTAQDFLRQVEQSIRSPHVADSCSEPE